MVCVKWQAQCLAYSDWSVTVSSCWWWSLHRLKILAHTRQKTQVYPTILSIDIYGAHRLCSEKAVATHSSALAWRIPGTEEPGGLLSVASHRVRHDWCDLAASDCVLRSLGSGTSLAHTFWLGVHKVISSEYHSSRKVLIYFTGDRFKNAVKENFSV